MAIRQSDQNFLRHQLDRLEEAASYLRTVDEAEALRRSGEEITSPEGYSYITQQLQHAIDEIVLRIITQGDGRHYLDVHMRGADGNMKSVTSRFGKLYERAKANCPHAERGIIYVPLQQARFRCCLRCHKLFEKILEAPRSNSNTSVGVAQ